MYEKDEKVKKIRDSLARIGRYARARDKALSVLSDKIRREQESIQILEVGLCIASKVEAMRSAQYE